MYGNRSYQLQQIITLQEKCNITDFCVDANDNFIVSTLNSNRVYVYQQMHDLVTLEDQGWRLVAKVFVIAIWNVKCLVNTWDYLGIIYWWAVRGMYMRTA